MITLAIFISMITLIFIIGKMNNQADWGNSFANVLDGLIRVYCRKYHRQSLQQLVIPTDVPVLIASNHISGIDPFLLISATDRPIRFMIAKEEYHRPLLHWMFKAAGCIPVDRGGRVEKAFRSALRCIQAGELVAVFPQGGIHHDTSPREIIKPGIIKLSQLSHCHILPIRINGIAAPGTIVAAVYKRSRVSLECHPMVSPQQVASVEFRAAISEWFLGKTDSFHITPTGLDIDVKTEIN